MTSHATAQERRLRVRLVQRAIETDAPLLAAPLHAYAQAEGLDWTALADSLGCMPDDLNRIALCRPPRPARFLADVREIAESCADPDRLLPLLRRLQILETFRADRVAESPAAYQGDHTLLAARDRTNDTDQAELRERTNQTNQTEQAEQSADGGENRNNRDNSDGQSGEKNDA